MSKETSRKSNPQEPKLRRRKPKQQRKISRGPHGFSVPEAGAMIGLGRNAAYRIARDRYAETYSLIDARLRIPLLGLDHVGLPEIANAI